MTGFQELDDLGKIVKKSNDFVRYRLNIQDLLAVRILACLASIVREEDMDFRELSISAKAILEHAGGANYKSLKTACDRLLGCILERKLDEKGGFQKYTLFSTIGYRNGVIFAKFHPDLKPFFLGLKSNFTKYDLKEFLLLPSLYSQRLFEYLKSWDDCSERVEEIQTVYVMLGIPDYARRNFKEFRRRVLDKAYQDILGKTSLRYEWEAIRKGTGKTSPVTAIRFVFSEGKLAAAYEKKREMHNKQVREERNRLFLKSASCLKNNPGCAVPRKVESCAVCFGSRGLELPDFLDGMIPVYK